MTSGFYPPKRKGPAKLIAPNRIVLAACPPLLILTGGGVETFDFSVTPLTRFQNGRDHPYTYARTVRRIFRTPRACQQKFVFPLRKSCRIETTVYRRRRNRRMQSERENRWPAVAKTVRETARETRISPGTTTNNYNVQQQYYRVRSP